MQEFKCHKLINNCVERQAPSGAPPGGFPSGPPPGGFPSGAPPGGTGAPTGSITPAGGTTAVLPATTGTGSIPVASTVPMTTVTPAPFTGTFPAGLTSSSQPVAAAQQSTALTSQINPIKFPDSG